MCHVRPLTCRTAAGNASVHSCLASCELAWNAQPSTPKVTVISPETTPRSGSGSIGAPSTQAPVPAELALSTVQQYVPGRSDTCLPAYETITGGGSLLALGFIDWVERPDPASSAGPPPLTSEPQPATSAAA